MLIPTPGVPPVPPLGPLLEAGVPLVTGEEFARVAEEHHERRRGLHRLVNNDGWSWPEGA